jgi:GNAT superfamily N-acetyltransferase
MPNPFRVLPLDAAHDRASFACGVPALDRYFQQQVTQDARRRMSACFVALDATERVAGYYTLAATSIPLMDLPPDISKKLPRYPSVPAVRMGRLAIATSYQGVGLGAALLANALQRSSRSEVAAYALLVDAKDAKAARFYARHGLQALPQAPLTLFIPLASVKNLVAE